MSHGKITKRVRFAAAHRILGYDGDCGFLHGHNYDVEVTVYGPTDNALGMVLDFKSLKGVLKGFVDQHLDHHVLLSEGDPLIPVLVQAGQRVFVMPVLPTGLRLSTTAEHIALLIRSVVERELPPKVATVSVRVYETPDSWADV